MKFEVVPVIEQMYDLYMKPRSMARFEAYIALLEGGSRGDMRLPISGYNPMGKEHMIGKLEELRALKAEELIAGMAEKLNSVVERQSDNRTIKLVLNVADDLMGGWTNRFTTDYTSKFKLNALVERNFCTPYIWSSEEYTSELIAARTLAYALRTLYWVECGRVLTLEQHVAQEAYVARHSGLQLQTLPTWYANMYIFFDRHRYTEDYTVLFNFFYGNAACRELGYATCGLPEVASGFDFARVS